MHHFYLLPNTFLAILKQIDGDIGSTGIWRRNLIEKGSDRWLHKTQRVVLPNAPSAFIL